MHFQKVEEFFADCEITLKELEDLHQYVEKSRTLRPSQVEDAINTSSDMAESTKMLVYNATETGNGLLIAIRSLMIQLVIILL